MEYRAHDYQKYATRHILDHPISALFLDCGLGKTIITLKAIHELCLDRFEIRKVLIAAPLRVARDTWPLEIEKWDCLDGLTWSLCVGDGRQRKAALEKRADIYIINRENLDWLVYKSGKPFDFDMVVLDELSSFKNHQSRRFKAMMHVRPKIKRIVGLTGTPASNSLIDLWAEFKVLDMGERLGRYITKFRNAYFLPDRRNAQMIYSWKPDTGSEQKIYDRIADITLSMKSKDYLNLPDLVVNEVPVIMHARERQIYTRLKKDLTAEIQGKEITAANAAALSGKLLQMANGCVYCEDGGQICIHERKLDALEDLVEAANGQPVLIAYWFKHDLQRIRERLKIREIRTQKDIRDWNQGKIPVACIHPAAAGHGLNLQAGGHILIWFGLTWSLELYLQTNARLYRQGQNETVIIHHLICKDTIDEQVMMALKQKDHIQNALMEAVKAEIGKGKE